MQTVVTRIVETCRQYCWIFSFKQTQKQNHVVLAIDFKVFCKTQWP